MSSTTSSLAGSPHSTSGPIESVDDQSIDLTRQSPSVLSKSSLSMHSSDDSGKYSDSSSSLERSSIELDSDENESKKLCLKSESGGSQLNSPFVTETDVQSIEPIDEVNEDEEVEDDAIEMDDQPLDFSKKSLDSSTHASQIKTRTASSSSSLSTSSLLNSVSAQRINSLYSSQSSTSWTNSSTATPTVFSQSPLQSLGSPLPAHLISSQPLPSPLFGQQSPALMHTALGSQPSSPMAAHPFLDPSSRLLMASLLRSEATEPSSPEALSSCSSSSSNSSCSSGSLGSSPFLPQHNPVVSHANVSRTSSAPNPTSLSINSANNLFAVRNNPLSTFANHLTSNNAAASAANLFSVAQSSHALHSSLQNALPAAFAANPALLASYLPANVASLSSRLANSSNIISGQALPRPSVIVSSSNAKHRKLDTSLSLNGLASQTATIATDQVDGCQKKSRLISESSAAQSIDEHFRRSLGNSYSELCSSNKNSVERSTTIESSATSVDDHFAKALGDTWFKLKKDSVVS